MSVDGVNVLTGETAGYEQGGYLLDPYETKYVDGWRKSQGSVSPFVFGWQHRSYAVRTHRPGNLGVIGVAVFVEDEKSHEVRHANHREAVLSGAYQGVRRDHPHLARISDPRRTTYQPVHGEHFNRAQWYPNQVATIRYDDERTLMRQGIVPDNRRGDQPSDPFPRRYVPAPPANWQDNP